MNSCTFLQPNTKNLSVLIMKPLITRIISTLIIADVKKAFKQKGRPLCEGRPLLSIAFDLVQLIGYIIKLGQLLQEFVTRIYFNIFRRHFH